MFAAWLEDAEPLLWLIPAALATGLAAFFALRRLGTKVRLAATTLRIAALIAIAITVCVPLKRQESKPAPDAVLLSANADYPVTLKARGVAQARGAKLYTINADGRVLDGKAEFAPSAASAVRKLLASPDAPRSVECWLDAAQLEGIAGLLEAAGVSHSTHPLTANIAAAAGSAAPDEPEPMPVGLPALTLDAPPVVLPHEPFQVRITPHYLERDTTVTLTFNGSSIETTPQPDGSLLSAAITPGRGAAHLTARVNGTRGHSAQASRSLAVTAPEEVIVLSDDTRLVQTVNALLPHFDVIGLPPVEQPEGWPFGRARAIVLPLLGEIPLPATLVQALEGYVSGGGALFVTGARTGQVRKNPPDPALTALLPVRMLPLPELPKPPPPKPEKQPDPPKPDTEEDPKDKPDEQPKVKTEEGAAQVAKVSVAFVIDHSGSMMFEKRWAHCKAAVFAALDRIQQYDRAGVILFTEKPLWIPTPTGKPIMEVLPSTATTIKNYLTDNGPVMAGQVNTDIYGAVEEALTQIKQEPSAVKLVLVISDGGEDPKRNFEVDHPRLVRDANANKVMIASIRVGAGRAGAGPEEAAAEKVMRAIVTQDTLAMSVRDVDGQTEIPALVITAIKLAYQRFAELKDYTPPPQKPEDKPPVDEPQDPPQEPSPEPHKEPDEEPKTPEPEDEEPKHLPLEFIPGEVPVLLSARGRSLLNTDSLPALGPKLAPTALRPDAFFLAALNLGESTLPGTRQPALAISRRGAGHIVYLAAPLDPLSSGSWLADSDNVARALDTLLRAAGRPRLPEMSAILGATTAPGIAAVRTSGAQSRLEANGVFTGGHRAPLDVQTHGEWSFTRVPIGVESVEFGLSGTANAAGVSMSAPPLALEQAGAPGGRRVTAMSMGILPAAAAPAVLSRMPNKGLAVMFIALALVLLPIERFVRRT